MHRHGAAARLAATLLLFAFAFLGGGKEGRAQEAEVQAAIDAYHSAFIARDLARMDSVWAHESNVMLATPTSENISIGWDAVQKNWEMQFNAISQVKLRQIDGPHIQIKGDMAWSMAVVNATVFFKTGAETCNPIFETDVLERTPRGWLIVSHISSAVPMFTD